MRIKSANQHQFARIPDVKIERSKFNRSHGHKTTFDAGYLIPIYCDEALPGDTFNLKMTAFARMSTPLKPLMDNLYMETFFFAVPNRLLWENWQRFCGEQDSPEFSQVDYVIPTIQAPAGGGFVAGSLSDYMGLPTEKDHVTVSALWHRAYNMIWNEWFRDQNLQEKAPQVIGDSDDYLNYTLRRRGKRHDYFTSCLPWPQKSEDPVTISLTGQADVYGNAVNPIFHNANQENGSLHVVTGALVLDPAPVNQGIDLYFGRASDNQVTGLEVDLTDVSAVTINALREAFQIQKLLERDARGGTRYIEIIKSHFGVTSPDFRMQRPEFLGGGSSPIVLSPVAQTSKSETNNPLGGLAAIGVATNQSGFVKSFTEHCTLLGLVSIRADLNYQQGINRMFSRSTRYDFYWPAFSHLGEQAVLNKEIYYNHDANDELVFGYQERYAEYRYKPSQITGQFRSNYATTLDMWHLAQDFASLPELGDTFIQENPPMTRVLAVASPHFLFDSYFDLNCVRPMPVYSAPGMLDHF